MATKSSIYKISEIDNNIIPDIRKPLNELNEQDKKKRIEDYEALKASIVLNKINITPALIRELTEEEKEKVGEGKKYALVDGRNRYNALSEAGIKNICAVLTDTSVLSDDEIQLVSNWSRVEMSKDETAEKVGKMVEDKKAAGEGKGVIVEIADRMGKTRQWINKLYNLYKENHNLIAKSATEDALGNKLKGNTVAQDIDEYFRDESGNIDTNFVKEKVKETLDATKKVNKETDISKVAEQLQETLDKIQYLEEVIKTMKNDYKKRKSDFEKIQREEEHKQAKVEEIKQLEFEIDELKKSISENNTKVKLTKDNEEIKALKKENRLLQRRHDNRIVKLDKLKADEEVIETLDDIPQA